MRNALGKTPTRRLPARRPATRAPLYATILFLILLIIAGAVAYLPQLIINKIEVDGARIVRAEAVEVASEDFLLGKKWLVLPRAHTWWYPKEELRAELLKQFPRLLSVNLSTKWPGILVVKVKERTPQLLYCPSTSCYFVDQNGVAYTESPTFSPGVFLEWQASSTALTIPATVSSAAEITRLLDIKKVIVSAFTLLNLNHLNIDNFTATPDRDFIFTIEGSGATSSAAWEILVDSETSPLILGNNLHAALVAILKESSTNTLPPLQYVDLRFGKKVFYKLYLKQ